MKRFPFADFLSRLANGALQQFAFDSFAGRLQAGNQRRSAGEQSGERAGELSDLKLENRFTDDGQLELDSVYGEAAFFRAGPRK